MRALVLALALILPGAVARAGCGPDAAAPCQIETGQYHAVLPDTPRGAPLVVFLHGAGGSGADVIRNTGLLDALLARGYALLAPDAGRIEGRDRGGIWNFYPGWRGRDEAAFLTAVADDAAHRFGLSREPALLAGFSAGGFMVSYIACAAPDSFAAYAPVAGGFWRPHPETCAGPVRLFQTHGWSDRTVPLEGRPLGGGAFEQGDIFAGLEIWRRTNRCTDMAPDGFPSGGAFWRRLWTGCAPGSALEFALFDGGHRIPAGWAGMVLDWFEAQTGEGP